MKNIKQTWELPGLRRGRSGFGTEFVIYRGVTILGGTDMKTNTFTAGNETEAIALVTFFTECGMTATRKGVNVKVTGEPSLVGHLFNIFVINALV